ncbi:MAG: tetratricopeptide repeat protein [Nitrospira sp. SB0667_bin_9]|nr:tetratricopeptide repeat protein [Nitrospira sp. SB0667_bin_9]
MHHGITAVVLGCLLMVTGCVTTSGPLAVLPVTSPSAAQQNLEGIQQYNSGNWQEAKSRFESAIQADPGLPEAHFNLALTLHKLGNHPEATVHFKRASELAPANKEIVGSSVYRNHLGLSSTLEKHLSGGYRY